MQMRTVTLLLSLLGVLVLGMFAYTYIQSQDSSYSQDVPQTPNSDQRSESEDATSTDAEPPQEQEADDTDRLQIVRWYESGVLYVRGAIETPTPCHNVSVEPVILETMPEQVVLDIQTEAGEGICTQVITEQTFTTSATTSPEATVVAAQINNTSVPIMVTATATPASLPE